MENFPNFADKLTVPGLYDALTAIGTAVRKTQKPERIVIIEELDAKIDEVLRRGVNGDGEDANEREEFVFAVPKTPAARRVAKTPSTRGRGRGRG